MPARNELASPRATAGWSGSGTSGTPASSFAQNLPLNAGAMDAETAARLIQSGLSGNARVSTRRTFDTDIGGQAWSGTIQGWPEPPPQRSTNPVCATDATNWAGYTTGAGYTAGRVTGLTGMVATTGYRVTNAVAGQAVLYAGRGTVTPGEPVTATLQARPSAATTVTWCLIFRNSAGTEMTAAQVNGPAISVGANAASTSRISGTAPAGAAFAEIALISGSMAAGASLTATGHRVDAVTDSAMEYSQTLSCAAELVFRNASGAQLATAPNMPSTTVQTGGPARVGAWGTAPAGTRIVDVVFLARGAGARSALWATAARLDRGSVTDLAPRDGDYTGWAWDGARYASTSYDTEVVPPEWKADTDSSSAATVGTSIGYVGTQYQPGPPAGSTATQPIQSGYTPIPVVAAPGGRPGRATRTTIGDNVQRYEHKPDHREFDAGDSAFFSVAFYLAADFPIDATDFQVIEQIHQAWGSWSPPVAFEVQRGGLYVTGGNGLPNGNSTGNPQEFAHFQRVADLLRERWYALVYRIENFSEQTRTSLLSVWLDGTVLLDRWTIPCPTLVQGDASTRTSYRKQGFYHRPSIPGGTIYHAGAALGSTFAAVDPSRQLSSVTYQGASGLAAGSTLSAPATLREAASATLSASGSLAAAVTRSSSTTVALPAAAALASTAVRVAPGDVALSAGADLTGAATPARAGSAALAGAAVLSGEAGTFGPGSALLDSRAALAGDATRRTSSPAALAAAAQLLGAAVRATDADGGLVAVTALDSAAVRAAPGAAGLFAAAELTGPAPGLGAGAAGLLAAAGSLAGVARLLMPGAAALAADSALGGSAMLVAGADGAMAAVTALDAYAGLPSTAAFLAADTDVAGAAGQPIRIGQASLVAVAALDGVGRVGFAQGAGLDAEANLRITALVFRPLTIAPPGPQAPLVRVPTLRLLACDTVTGRVGYELPYTALSWSSPVNGVPTGDTTLVLEAALDELSAQGAKNPRTALREILTGPFRYSFVVAWGAEALCGGPYQPSEDLTPGGSIKAGFVGLERVLERRVLTDPRGTGKWSDASRDVRLERTTPGGAIYRIVATATDTLDGERPTRALPIVCSDPPPLVGDETLTYLSYDLKMAWSAIEDITKRDDGPDVRLEPALVERGDGLYVEWDLQIGGPYLVGRGPTGPDGPLPLVIDDETSQVTHSVDPAGMGSAFWSAGSGQDRDKVIVRAQTDALTDLGFPELDTVAGDASSETDEGRLERQVRASAATGSAPLDAWAAKVRADGHPPRGAVRRGDPITVEALSTLLIEPGSHTRRVTTVAGDAGLWDTWTLEHEDALAEGDPVALGRRITEAPSIAPTGTVVVPGSGGVDDTAARWIGSTKATKGDASTTLPITSPATAAGQQMILLGATDTAGTVDGFTAPTGWTLLGSSPDPHGGWVKVWTRLSTRADVGARYTLGQARDRSCVAYCLSFSTALAISDGPVFTGGGANPGTRMPASAMVAPAGAFEIGLWSGADESGSPTYTVPSGWSKSGRGDADSGGQTGTVAVRSIARGGQTDEPVTTKSGSAVRWSAVTLTLGGAAIPRLPAGAARKVTNLTGPAFSDRYGIGGTDLGVVEPAPDGRLLVVFGDTFEQATVGGPGWRTPAALYADPARIAEGLRWTGAAPGSNGTTAYAGQLVPDPHNATLRGSFISTQLPTDVITIGSTMYMHVMACEGLGNVHFTELYKSTDNGATWSTTGCWWDGASLGGLFQMVTFERGGDGYVYCISTGFQRDKGLILQRVPEGSFATASAWQPWGYSNGAWAWGKPATQIFGGAWGELCLRRLASGRWLFSGFDAGNYQVSVRDLGVNGPTSDFTKAPVVTLVRGCGWEDEDHSKGLAAQLYGGYLVPGSTLADAHFVVSQWNTGTNWPYRSMQFRADLAATFGGA